jgi:hypothetical protein
MSFIERLTENGQDSFITLQEIKNWLKIEHDLDNVLLENLRAVAVIEAYNFTQNDFEEENELGELVILPIPFVIKMACLMYIAYLYENRGDEQTSLPHNCMRLLMPYKKLVGT